MPKSAKNIKGEAKNVNLPSYNTKTCHFSAHNVTENEELQMDEGALREPSKTSQNLKSQTQYVIFTKYPLLFNLHYCLFVCLSICYNV